MTGAVSLTPDQLAELVAAVFETNGYKVSGVGLYLEGKLVAFDQATVHCQIAGIEVYPPPKGINRQELDTILKPNGHPEPTLGTVPQ